MNRQLYCILVGPAPTIGSRGQMPHPEVIREFTDHYRCMNVQFILYCIDPDLRPTNYHYDNNVFLIDDKIQNFLLRSPEFNNGLLTIAFIDYRGTESGPELANNLSLPLTSRHLYIPLGCGAPIFDPYCIVKDYYDPFNNSYNCPCYSIGFGSQLPSNMIVCDKKFYYSLASKFISITRSFISGVISPYLQWHTDELRKYMYLPSLECRDEIQVLILNYLQNFIRHNTDYKVPHKNSTIAELHDLQLKIDLKYSQF